MYGYTPDEVDELPVEALNWWPTIEEAEAKAVERKQKMESQKRR